MPRPVILFYTPSPVPYASKLLSLCAVQGFPLHKVTVGDLDRPLSALAQGLPAQEESPVPGEPLPESVLIFCHLSNAQLDRLLPSLRRIQARCLKAVLTPTNAQWTPRTLYGELCRERDQLGGAHSPKP